MSNFVGLCVIFVHFLFLAFFGQKAILINERNHEDINLGPTDRVCDNGCIKLLKFSSTTLKKGRQAGIEGARQDRVRKCGRKSRKSNALTRSSSDCCSDIQQNAYMCMCVCVCRTFPTINRICRLLIILAMFPSFSPPNFYFFHDVSRRDFFRCKFLHFSLSFSLSSPLFCCCRLFLLRRLKCLPKRQSLSVVRRLSTITTCNAKTFKRICC